jgi:hypothetical protein
MNPLAASRFPLAPYLFPLTALLLASCTALTAADAWDPKTYPDEKGFKKRADMLIDGLVQQDLGTYRRGWFKGGDPGKYLPAHAMARLLRDRKDPDALKYMNDERAPRQHYHFACVNWARFLPLFGDVLTDAAKEAFMKSGARAGTYCTTHMRGTENHHVMQLTSGVVLPDYVTVERFGGRDRAACQGEAKRWLRWYVKGLYARGQGEWDSSTYIPFDINGMLNIYDCSKEEESRLLARAALDWYAMTLAVKYVNGMHTGPKERGWTSKAFSSGGCMTSWLWWGSTGQPDAKRLKGARTTVHPITSTYRPNEVLCSIARRDLPGLPAEFQNSKPDYWHGLDKPPHSDPVLGQSAETLYVHRLFTMGTMWSDPDTCTQLTRMQLGVKTKDGAVSFTGSAPGSYNGKPKYASGQGTHITRPSGDVDPKTEAIYVQYAQAGPVVICMAKFPDEAEEKFTYFSTPVEARKIGSIHVMAAGDVYVGILPLADTAEKADFGGKKGKLAALKFPGTQSGWIMMAAEQQAAGGPKQFARAFRDACDVRAWPKAMTVSVKLPGGRELRMQYRSGKQRCSAWIDDQPVRLDRDWVYDGPYVKQKDGVLTVNNGREGFVVDFAGDLPVYGKWHE